MGYIIVKPQRGGIQNNGEYLHVSKSRISFSKDLYVKLGLTARKKCAVMYIDSDTRMLCFDFKDYPFRDAFLVSVSVNRQNSTTVCIYATKTIELLGIETGKYHITSQDGSVYKTDILTHLKPSK